MPKRLCGFLLFSLVFLCPLTLRGESRLVFPRLLYQQGRFSGVAIANPGSTEARITLTAYNPDGTLFSGAGVTNPRTDTISAGSQYAKLATEIFTPPASVIDSPTARTLWMEVTSPTDGLTGFFLDGSNSIDFLDGSDLSGSGADLVLPFVQVSSQVTTELTLVNPDGAGAAGVTVELVGEDGKTIRAHDVTVPARGALQGSASALFPGSFDAVRTIRFRGSRPLACVAFITRQAENSLVAVAARKSGSPTKTLYFPQLAQGGEWSTAVGLVNLTSSEILVTLTAYRADGTIFAPPTVGNNPVSRTIAAGGSLRAEVQSLFAFAGGPLQVGWIKAEANDAAFTGYVEYGAGTNRALVSAQPDPVTRAVFSHQANASPYYTGLAVLNPGSLAANIEVVSLSGSSLLLGKTRRVLRPGQREAVLIEQWIPGAAGAVGGMIFLKSDIPVIASQLFGTSIFTALSNVPPQAVPAGFDPGAGAASLKVSPPLAVVETGKSMKFTATGPAIGSWAVNGQAGGAAGSGTVSNAGLFTAPALVPSQHTQTVQASSSGGDQSGAASVDVVQREVLTAALTLLTSVAYFQDLQRFFIAEQQLISSAPAGGRVNATTANTRVSEVSTSGTAQQFSQIPNDTVSKMLPYTDGAGASHLLLAGIDTGTIYKLSIAGKTLSAVATGLKQPSSLALDPVSGNLYVAETGANQITVIERSRFDSSVSAPAAYGAAEPAPAAIAVTSPRGIAFDPCTGALFVSSADGVLREFLDNRERPVVSGVGPGQVLVLQRRGMPSCFEAVTVFVAEGARVAQIDPREGLVIAFLDAVQDVRDLAFFDADSPFAGRGEETVVVAEGPAGAGLSRVLLVPVGDLYQRDPADSRLGGGLEFNPAGDSIAFRDRRGDTFATARSQQAGLYVPDITAVSIHRAGAENIVTVTFAGPVAPAARGAFNSITGWIDFDTQQGSGVASHADPYHPLRPGAPETDYYIDLSSGTLQLPSVGASQGLAAAASAPVSLSYLGNTMTAAFSAAIFSALDARVSVTAGNSAEVTDIAPESRYAFINRTPDATPDVQFSQQLSVGAESTTPVLIDVVLSRPASKTVTVSYSVSGGTATGGLDYTLAAGALSFAPGERSKSIAVAIVNDSADEPDETVIITLSGPSNAYLGARRSHTYTILDDDSPTPRLQFAIASSSGAESVAAVNLTVALSSSTTQTVTVQYAVSGGTATGGGVDYSASSGTLTFSPGETSKTIPLTVVNDALDEPDETVIVALSNPVNATAGANMTHTYTILDNDPAPTIQFGAASSQGAESTTSVSIPVTLSAPSGFTVTAQATITGGAAKEASDFSLAAGTLTFSPGQTTRNVLLTIINDTEAEADETIVVTLSGLSNCVPGSPILHTYTILDNDAKPDLVVSAISARPTQVLAGGTVTLSSWTVTNTGPVSAGAFTNGFYLSKDAIISADDTYLTGNSNSGLAPKESFTWVAPTLTIPGGAGPGQYWIGVLVDRLNAVAESNETNNYASTPINVYILLAPQNR